MEQTPILTARNLCKNFGAITAAADISTTIFPQCVLGLIGANGAGKTTFINMITGYLKPDSGSIHFKGSDITPLHPREITQLGVCRSFQIPQLYDSLTVEENILVGLGIISGGAGRNAFSALPGMLFFPRQSLEEEADALLKRFSLTDYRGKLARVLPGGVRKLLDIAMSMVGKPQIMMLDEPTSGVSADQKFEMMDMIMGALQAEGVTILFVEHDMDIIGRYSKRVMAFYEGSVIADGKPEDVMNDDDVRQYVIGDQALGKEGAGQRC